MDAGEPTQALHHESTRFRRSERVDETRVADRVVLFHRDSGTGVVLNPTGSLIWDSLTSPKSAEELMSRLGSRFAAIPAERIAEDVSKYVESLIANDLIAAEQ